MAGISAHDSCDKEHQDVRCLSNMRFCEGHFLAIPMMLSYRPHLVNNGLRRRITAMKKEIHPEYHEITVQMTDGTTYQTRSTWGNAGDTLKLDVDPLTHPAWTGVHRLLDSGGQLAKFNKRFEKFGLES